MARIRDWAVVLGSAAPGCIERSTDQGDDVEDLILEFAESPARVHIVAYIDALRDMGFNLRDPDLIRRAIDAGVLAHERDHDRGRHVTAPSLFAAKPGHHNAVVYYMRLGSLVKIGTTMDITSRVKAVAPDGVLAIEFGAVTSNVPVIDTSRRSGATASGFGSRAISWTTSWRSGLNSKNAPGEPLSSGSLTGGWIVEVLAPIHTCSAVMLDPAEDRVTLPASPRCPIRPALPRGFGTSLYPAEVLVSSANLDAGLPRSLAAQRLGVTPHTVSMWALRGWIDSTGRRRKLRVVGREGGQRLYRYGDLLEAERDTRRKPSRSHRAA